MFSHIMLGANSIEDQGAERIALALKKNSTVTSVNLGANRIGAQGADRIALALKRNREEVLAHKPIAS